MIKEPYSAPLTQVAVLQPGSVLAASYKDGGDVFDLLRPEGFVINWN